VPQQVQASARSSAPREQVWKVVSDGSGWWRWGAWRETRLEREGSPPPDGLGAIRVLVSEARGPTGRPVTSREQVTEYDPPSRFGYELLSGLPLRDYNASITLSDAAGGGTDIVWRSRFDAKLPLTGGLFRRALQRFTDDAVKRLAREAESDRTAQPS
jgi:hypothetical protein